jgi:hypothetical protein
VALFLVVAAEKSLRNSPASIVKIGVHGEHSYGLVEHGCGYQQNKAHDPELELLFTHAETAW